MATTNLQELPVELLGDILALLDIPGIVSASQVCRQLRSVCENPLLDPWRPQILRLLKSDGDLHELKNLSEYSLIPRQNYVDILSLAPPHVLLMEMTLPALHRHHWDEIINRRFLPSWKNARYTEPKEQFMRLMWNIWHRLNTNCTTTQAWCTYVYITRTGHLNVSAAYSRTYEPFGVFEELKAQSDLSHQETEVRVLLQLTDVRILALGVLYRPSSFYHNNYARMLLHPPGVEAETTVEAEDPPDTEVELADPTEVAVDETPDSPDGAVDLLTDLQPSLSRESGYSPSSRSRSRDRSWSNVASSSVARMGVSLFRTRSLPVDNTPPPSPSLLWRLTRSRRLSAGGPSSPPHPDTILESVPAPSPPPIELPTTIPLPASNPASPTTKFKKKIKSTSAPYPKLQHPLPATEFRNYPNVTPGGADTRWRGSGELEEGGLAWAGPMLITAQITGERWQGDSDNAALMTHGRFASFGAQDFFAIAPWMKEKIGRVIEGPGLGN